MAKKSRAFVKHNMERVLALQIKGYNRREIIKITKIPERTVDRYSAKNLQKLKTTEIGETQLQAYNEIKKMHGLRVKSLWTIVNSTDTPIHSKTTALGLLGKEEERFVRRCQLFGIVPTESLITIDNSTNTNTQVFNAFMEAFYEDSRNTTQSSSGLSQEVDTLSEGETRGVCEKMVQE